TCLLATGRIAATIFEEERHATSASEDLTNAQERQTSLSAAKIKRTIAITLMLAVIALGLASEVGAGLAYESYFRHKTVIQTVEPFYQERDDLISRLIENIQQQEEA